MVISFYILSLLKVANFAQRGEIHSLWSGVEIDAGWDTRCEVRDASISIKKFTKYRWNDCVFERTEEHRRCSRKCTRFLKRKDFFYSHYVFKGAKLAKFIRHEAVGKLMWDNGMMRWCDDVMIDLKVESSDLLLYFYYFLHNSLLFYLNGLLGNK